MKRLSLVVILVSVLIFLTSCIITNEKENLKKPDNLTMVLCCKSNKLSWDINSSIDKLKYEIYRK